MPEDVIDQDGNPAPTERGPRQIGTKDLAATKRLRVLAMSRIAGKYSFDDDIAGTTEFDGDALDFLRVVYRDPRIPLDVRIDAAKTAVRFERPSLQAVEVGGKGGGAISVVMLPSDEAL